MKYIFVYLSLIEGQNGSPCLPAWAGNGYDHWPVCFCAPPLPPTKMILSTRKSKRSPKRLREDALSNLASKAFHTAVFWLYLCKELTGLMRNWISWEWPRFQLDVRQPSYPWPSPASWIANTDLLISFMRRTLLGKLTTSNEDIFIGTLISWKR